MPKIHNMVDTWNDVGTDWTAIKMDIDNQASSANSFVIDLQVDSSTVFGVRKDGSLVSDFINWEASGFSAVLASGDDTLQKVFDKVDALPTSWDDSGFGGVLANGDDTLQEVFDKLDTLDYASGNHVHNSGDIVGLETFVDNKINALVDSAPTALDTLNELAAALGDDANFSATVTTSLSEKLVKADNLSDLANAATARTNLGLGTAGLNNSGDYAFASHTHTLSDITDAGSIASSGADDYAAASHTHDYAAGSHTHTLSEITDAGSIASSGADDYAAASHTHTLSEITDAGTIASSGADDYAPASHSHTESFNILVTSSDETTDLAVGTGAASFRIPFSGDLTEVRASVATAPVGANLIVDINKGGTSVLSTKLSIDAGEKTSTTAATPPVISNTVLPDDSEITIDIDQIGSTTAGAGLKVTLKGTK